MGTKVRELTPITKARSKDSSCVICHPRKDRVREDQLWGHCPTNMKHTHTKETSDAH